MSLQIAVVAFLGLVIGILIFTSLGTTVVDQTETRTCLAMLSNETGRDCSLENASTTGKTMYSLLELLYPIVGVLLMIGVGFGMKDRF